MKPREIKPGIYWVGAVDWTLRDFHGYLTEDGTTYNAYLIMDENNPAPRLLSRPGEGIYNDAGGAMEGNSPFQVVWLSDEERDEYLDKVRVLGDTRSDRHRSPIVFEGNAPASVQENDLLTAALATKPLTAPPRRRSRHRWTSRPSVGTRRRARRRRATSAARSPGRGCEATTGPARARST